MKKHIAFLGTGLLGSAMVQRQLSLGKRVTVWNRTESKARNLIQFGAELKESPEAAIEGAEFVHTVLKDDESVDAVLNACGDLLKGSSVLDHTTLLPLKVLHRIEQMEAKGVRYLHAPVFMGPEAARNAKGSLFASGKEQLWIDARSELESMTANAQYLGERADLAAIWKLAGNAMIIGVNAMLADTLALSDSCGVDPVDIMKVFETVNPCSSLSVRGKKMAEGDFTPSFELSMARKDIQLMLTAASGARGDVYMLPAIAARMDALISAGYGSEDLSVMAHETTRRKRKS